MMSIPRIIGGAVAAADAPARAIAAAARVHGGLLRGLWSAARREREARSPAKLLPAAALAALWRRWALLVVGATVAGVGGALAAGSGHWSGALTGAAVAAALLALATESGLANWQGRHGRPASSWREWLPEALCPPDGGHGRGLASVAVLLLAGVAVLPSVAWAAAEIAGGQTQDAAIRAIDLLFPAGGGEHAVTPLSRSVGLWSSILLAAGAGGMTLTTMQAVEHAARTGQSALNADGEFFGAGAIIRVCVCIGLLVPVSGGLGGGQMAFAALARWSSETATALSSAHVADVLRPGGEVPQPGSPLGLPVDAGGLALARALLTGETCAAWLQTEYDRRVALSLSTRWMRPVSLPPAGGADDDGAVIWGWGDRCGRVAVAAAPDGAPAALVTYHASRREAVSALLTGLREARLPSTLASWAPGGDGEWPPHVVGLLRPLADQYDAAVLGAASRFLGATQASERSRVVDGLTAQGWVQAGAASRLLAQVHAQAVDLAREAPAVRAPDVSWLERGLGPALTEILARLDADWTEALRDRSLSPGDLAASGDDGANLLTRIINSATRPITEALLADSRGHSADPLAESVSLGLTIVSTVEATRALTLVLGAASTSAPAAVLGGGGAWMAAADFSSPILWWLYGIGLVHAYILPVIPWIAVVFGGLSFMLALAEGLIAIPLLAFLGLKFSGKEFLDAALKPGLLLAANALVLPVYTVLALQCTYLLLPLALGMVNDSFTAAFLGSQGGSVLGVGGIVAALTLQLWMHWQVMVRVFAFIHEGPNRLLAWWGSSSERADGRGTTALVAGVGGGRPSGAAAGRAAGGGASKVGGGGGGRGVGVRPVTKVGGGDVGGGGDGGLSADHWARQTGGLDRLSPDQQAAAEESYNRWAEAKPSAADKYDLSSYVDYAQGQQAARPGRGEEP